MFAPGQAYVAISRAKTWDTLTLTALDHDSIKTNEKVIIEYQCLQDKYNIDYYLLLGFNNFNYLKF